VNPLFLTIAVLTLLSVITCGSMKRAVDRTASHQLLLGGLEAAKEARNQYERQLYLIEISKRAAATRSGEVPEEVKDTKKSRGTGKTKRKKYWTPLCTRLNLNRILNEKRSLGGQSGAATADPWTAIAAGLLRQLYGHCNWFQQVSEAEYRIVERLRAQCQLNEYGNTQFGFRGNLELTDHLAAIPMEDEGLQRIWLKMVLGGPSYPSLLDSVELSEEKKINIVLAPEPLLAAIFSPADAKLIAETRDSALDDFFQTLEENPDNADANFVTQVVKSLVMTMEVPDQYRKLFDYKLTNRSDQMTVKGHDKQSGIRAVYRFHTPPIK
jgi:hypothetical protein